MYSGFYNLSGLPFQLTPDPAFFFASKSHNKALAHLAYGVDQGEGVTLVAGGDGIGKTTLIARFLNSLAEGRYRIACLVGSHLAPDSALPNVANRLGVDHADVPRDALLGRIRGALAAAREAGQQVLIIVDDAQDVPVEFLEDLRLVTDLKVGEEVPAQLILLGGYSLRDRLNKTAELEALRRRVVTTCMLLPMTDVQETRAYVLHRLGLVGWNNDPTFTDGAFEAIHNFCGGVPRRINQLCARLLLHGCLESLHEIGEDAVSRVISELVVDHEPQPAENMPVADVTEAQAPEPVEPPCQSAARTVVFDRESVIATDDGHEPASALGAAAAALEPAEQKQAESPAPAAAARVGAPGDASLVAAIIGELASLDPALPALLAADIQGKPAPEKVLGEGGDALRLGLGPLTSQMLYRAVLREVQALDPDLVAAALGNGAGAGEIVAELPAPDEAGCDEIAERLHALEKRIKANEKLLGKTLKALKKLK